MRRTALLAVLLAVLVAAPAGASDSVGLVDKGQGYWWLRDPATGDTTSFFYGNPRDFPFTGDWNCDGVDTPGLYRQSDGFVYLRNSNTQGVADVRFYFGDPGDVPVPGDFDGDGCDTVSLYRPSEQRFYLIDRLGSEDGGLGVADRFFRFGDPGDTPLAGDFDGDGTDEVAVLRGSTLHVRYAADRVTTLAAGAGKPVVGRWAGSSDTVGSFSAGAFSLGAQEVLYGSGAFTPLAGEFGALPGGDAAPPIYPNVGSGKRIIFDTGEQRVWLVESDGRLAHTWLVSGRKDTPAPGAYAVYSKSLWTTAGHDGITMTHMVRFAWGSSLSIGFHAIPRWSDGSALQTEQELGTYQSAGCVRLADAAASTLYDWAGIGTQVVVIP